MIIAVSEFVKREALRLDIPPAKITVIYDGVDTRVFDPKNYVKTEARKQFNLDPDVNIVLMIARFAPCKRHALILEALRMVKERIDPVQLVFAGEVFEDTRYFESIQGKVKECGLDGAVRFIGFQANIEALHAAADVVVSCSDREGLPHCILEAMAMQVPVVATDSGGSRELIHDEATGYIVAADDICQLAVRITELLSDPEKGAAVAHAARQHVENELTAAASAIKVMKAYETILAHMG